MNRVRLFVRATRALRDFQRRQLAALATSTCHVPPSARGSCNNGTIAANLYSSRFCSNQAQLEYEVDNITYDRVCSETLDALADYFEELTENATDLPETDVVYGDGVLSVNLGPANGTYVINRQKPNKQIWLSSPISGPKRFDYVLEPGQKDGYWIYKHTGATLHGILQEEIGKMLKTQPVDFSQLPFCH